MKIRETTIYRIAVIIFLVLFCYTAVLMSTEKEKYEAQCSKIINSDYIRKPIIPNNIDSIIKSAPIIADSVINKSHP